MKKIKSEFLAQEISFSEPDFKIVVQNCSSKITERAFHEAVEIKYFYEGRGMQMIDTDIIIAEPGDITIANPYEIHTNTETDFYKGKYFLLIVDLDFFMEYNPKGIDLRNVLIAKGQKFNNCIRDNNRMQTIILRIVEELSEKKEPYRLIIYSLMSELFALLLREEINHDKSRVSQFEGIKRANLIAPALSKIFADYDKRITIDELANLCKISKYHFCRIFKDEMGVTAIQYIMRYRIALAEALLKDEEKNVDEIAYQCGFDDLSYFYRCYKKINGRSPKSSVKKN